MQTLKSVQATRVDVSRAQSLGAAARNLGEPLMCSAGSHALSFDEYGRPAGQNTLTVHLDASCGQLSQFGVAEHINRESLERPYLSIAPPGLRGNGDLSNTGRDLHPQGLYENNTRGNFVRHYSTPNNAPPAGPVRNTSGDVIYNRVEVPFDFSHDATRSARF